MKSIHSTRGSRTFLGAALLFGAALAQAADGYTVTAAQEKTIKVGMSRAEVRQALGRPAHNMKFASEPGRTWTYGVVGGKDTVFDVDFTSDGKVTSSSERLELMN